MHLYIVSIINKNLSSNTFRYLRKQTADKVTTSIKRTPRTISKLANSDDSSPRRMCNDFLTIKMTKNLRDYISYARDVYVTRAH